MSEILLLMCSSRIFIIWGVILKSFVHFEFILVCGMRKWSSFNFLHLSAQFSQHHLLNKISLVYWMCLLPVKYQLTIKMCIYFWALYSVPLMYVFVFMSVPCCFDYYGLVVQFDIGQCDSSNFVLSQDCCFYAGPLVVPQKFLKYLFQFCEIHHWNLERNCIESIDCFGQYGHFNNVNSSYL